MSIFSIFKLNGCRTLRCCRVYLYNTDNITYYQYWTLEKQFVVFQQDVHCESSLQALLQLSIFTQVQDMNKNWRPLLIRIWFSGLFMFLLRYVFRGKVINRHLRLWFRLTDHNEVRSLPTGPSADRRVSPVRPSRLWIINPSENGLVLLEPDEAPFQ